MKLTGEQVNTVIAKLEAVAPNGCPGCGQSPLSVGDTIFELREFQGGNLVVGGSSSLFPVVPVVCTSCGHVIFFSAMALDVVKPPVDGEADDD